MFLSLKNILVFFLIILTAPLFAAFPDDSAQIILQRYDSLVLNVEEKPNLDSTILSTEKNDSLEKNYIYEFRITSLARKSPIKLEYNKDVRKQIDSYLTKRKNEIPTLLGLSEIYFPVFEECLARYNLPLEFKYLPVMESSLNARAVSSSGAAGLWQFLYHAALLFDLNIDSYTDERCELYASTDAACRYLKYLYAIFNDWQLVLAAYNGGPGEVRNAIIRSGGKINFWELQSFLPTQTRWYVPKFIATVYVMEFAKEHKISAKKPEYNFRHLDTLMISNKTDLKTVSNYIDIPFQTIIFLNPFYKLNIIPESEKPLPLILPANKIRQFLKNNSKIYSSKNDTSNFHSILKNAGDTINKTKIEYIVQQGDFLHKIAILFECTDDDIRAWNILLSDNLNSGQKLNIWLSQENAENYSPTNTKKKKKTTFTETIEYTVKNGDTIYSIARKFNCSVDVLLEENNITDEKQLIIGKKIKIKR